MELKYIKNNPITSATLLLGFIYLLFPTNNSTIDAYSYAADILYNWELLNPHHLLYSAFGAGIKYFHLKVLHISVDELSLMKKVNAVAAAFSIFTLGHTLKKIGTGNRQIFSLLILAGSAFGFMRFATENETYILPVTLSLGGTYYWVGAQESKQTWQYLLSGSLLSLACLFHQIHFFWWLGLGVPLLLFPINKVKHLKDIVAFFLPALIVPIIYSLAVYLTTGQASPKSFIQFVFREFYRGNVETEIGFNNVLLTSINFIRTWVQVHGNMLKLFQLYPMLTIAIISAISLIGYGMVLIFRQKFSLGQKSLLYPILTVLFLQISFAFYSVGNAEFMVMLPSLFCLLIVCIKNLEYKPYLLIGLGILTWNLFLSVIPAHFLQLSGNSKLSNYIMTHKDTMFLVNDKVQMETEILYFTGKYPENVIPSPEYCQIKFGNIDYCKKKIDSSFLHKKTILTDIYENESFINRGMILSQGENGYFLKKFNKNKVDSLSFDLGVVRIYQLKK